MGAADLQNQQHYHRRQRTRRHRGVWHPRRGRRHERREPADLDSPGYRPRNPRPPPRQEKQGVPGPGHEHQFGGLQSQHARGRARGDMYAAGERQSHI